MSGPFNYFSDFSLTEDYLWQDAFGESFNDPVAEALFHEAYFVRNSSFNADELSAIRENLNAYMADTYGIDFEAEFDWDIWRAAYAGEA
jgi:hypothetical protein